MDKAKFQAAEQHFKTIRDERGLRQNTATRIGTAFLELLYLLEDASEEELDHFANSPIFEKGLISLAAILFGNYVKGQSGGSIDEKGDAELNDLTLRGDAIIPSILESTVFRKGLLTLGKILFGNYVKGESGGYIDENGNGELESLVVRSGMTIDKFLNQPTFVNGLITLGNVIIGEYAEGLKGGLITPEAYAELKELYIRETAKLGRLKVEGDSVFNGNLSSPDFVSDFLGGLGWAIQKQEVENAAGEIETRYHLEIDNATIRGSLRVFEMIISQLLGENGNRFFSDMMEVDHYDSSTGRIWLNTQNGKLYNPFRVGDIIMVQQYNGEPTAENNWYVTKSYELRITAVGVGEQQGEDRLDWVMFDNFTTTVEGLTPETAITKGDTLVRADNETNKNRKGLLTIMSVGENTPYMDILYGLKTDPKHALKGRTGNLEGIITDVFGSLEGFGAYLNNLYAVGKFFNSQTGESINARIEGTKANLRSVYSETIYNIPEDENFISNGFFQHGLNNWTACNVDGSSAAAESNEVLGLNSSPLLVNGLMINAKSKSTAEVKVVDGISMLHLRSMGIAQQFSVMTANGSHKVMNSGTESDTATKNVADTLYMGIRILPSTSGTLKVSFVKEDGTTTGWERDITSSTSWQLQQAQDYEELPWKYDGNGRMIISYTGECYIRFVALRADAISNTKIEYSTLFEQTSRKITLQAERVTNQGEQIALLQITADNITQTVTDNKRLADEAIEARRQELESYIALNDPKVASSASWIDTNKNWVDIVSRNWDANGNLLNNSSITVYADGIKTSVEEYTDDKLTNYYTKEETAEAVKTKIESYGYVTNDGVTSRLSNYYTKEETADAVKTKIESYGYVTNDVVTSRLSNYYTKEETADVVKQTLDSYSVIYQEDLVLALRDYSTTRETSSMFSREVARAVSRNLLGGYQTRGWEGPSGSDVSYNAKTYQIGKTGDGDLYSPIIQLMSDTTYCFSAEFDDDPNGEFDYKLLGSYNYENSDIAHQSGSQVFPTLQMTTIDGQQRYYFTFKTGSGSQYVVFNYYYGNYAYLYRPQLEIGSEPTAFMVHTVEAMSNVKMTADAVEVSVADKLNQAGINITTKEIELLAGKVTFGYYDNGTKKTDKIWIDTSTGTLHAVDGDFSGKITATEGTIGGFSIGGNYIGSAEYSSGLWGGMQLYKDGRLYMGNDEYNYALRGNGGFEWVGNGKDITLSAVTGSVYNHGNVVLAGYLKFAGLPTSSSGLTSGEVYRDGNTLKIV